MSAVDTQKARARPLSPEDRRAAILDAVVPLLIDHGAAVTTAEMAEAAGIAEGTIFRVFPDKASLLPPTMTSLLPRCTALPSYRWRRSSIRWRGCWNLTVID